MLHAGFLPSFSVAIIRSARAGATSEWKNVEWKDNLIVVIKPHLNWINYTLVYLFSPHSSTSSVTLPPHLSRRLFKNAQSAQLTLVICRWYDGNIVCFWTWYDMRTLLHTESTGPSPQHAMLSVVIKIWALSIKRTSSDSIPHHYFISHPTLFNIEFNLIGKYLYKIEREKGI